MTRPSNHIDVAVVGAGAVGCASAYFLSESQREVMVFDAGRIGYGASYGNAGHLTPGDAIPLASPGVVGQALKWALRADSPFSMNWRLTPGYAAWLLAFARWSRRSIDVRVEALKALAELSLDLVEAMPEDRRRAFEYAQSGVLNVYQSADGLRAGLGAAETLRRYGIDLEVLDGDEVRARAGFDGAVEGGVLFRNDARCNPAAYVQQMASAAAERGVVFRENEPVTAVRSAADGRYTVETAAGVVTATSVVLSSGTGIASLSRALDVRVPIIGGGGYSVDIELAPEPKLPMLFHEHRVAVTAIGGYTRVAGLMELGRSAGSVNPRKARYLLRTAREVFPTAPTFRPREVWRGVRPCTPDGVPIIGRVPGHRNVVIAGGHALVGMTLAAGTGRLVADLVDERALSIPGRAFELERF